MSSFRIIGIRPLLDCDSDLTKVLEKGKVYHFYNDITLLPERMISEMDEVTAVVGPKIPDLYNFRTPNLNNISVNISAIVGKNGSGKSTILELLYGAMFILAEDQELLINEGVEYYRKELEKVTEEQQKYSKNPYQTRDQSFEDTFRNLREILAEKLNSEEKFNHIQELLSNEILRPENYENKKNSIAKRLGDYTKIYNGLKLDIYFQNEYGIYVLSINSNDKDKISIKTLTEGSEKLDKRELLASFCYSIVINYSIYGLNNRVIGDWINPLFHKNDGYQTPIVLNPMREDGNFDINTEEYLAKYRLSSNLLIKTKDNSHRKLTDNQTAEYFLFRLDQTLTKSLRFNRTKEGIDVSQFEDSLAYKIQQSIYKRFGVDENRLQLEKIPAQVIVENYVINKVEKIIWKYPNYKTKYTTNTTNELNRIFDTVHLHKIDNLAKELFLDNSHITFKLKQAINFLKYNPLKESVENSKEETKIFFNGKEYTLNKWENQNAVFSYLVSIKDLSEIIESNRTAENKYVKDYNEGKGKFELGKLFELSYINLIPPSLFQLDVLMSTSTKYKYSSFSSLSSGEQQRIHSIQTVLYHINNINSVFNQPSQSQNEKPRIEYRNVNIVLDEIELYFHPDFQRRFIFDLLSAISKLNIGGARGVKEINILFATHSPFILSDIPSSNILRLDKGKPQKNDRETFGANIHDLLANSFFLDKTFIGEKANQVLIKLIDDIKGSSTTFNYESLKAKINLIGEPFIREKLNEMLERNNWNKSKANDQN